MGGRSGVGRRTAVSLVAFMHQITLYTPNVSRNFGVKQFKNDLKNVRMHVRDITSTICLSGMCPQWSAPTTTQIK